MWLRGVRRLKNIDQLRVVDITFWDGGSMTRNTHKRDRVQESGSLRWILLSEMGSVSVLGSSM